ncbi:MAG: choice-of-anchor D domain-containing protein [Saccharospirillum sp.]|uniref:choice-of-anchor D domain-containing protein n=1 Tax=Saccharospirillum sp. TaxID=2033801 RepID=UPI003296CD13
MPCELSITAAFRTKLMSALWLALASVILLSGCEPSESNSSDTTDASDDDNSTSLTSEVTLSSNSLDFGTVASGLMSERTVWVTNTGTEEVTGFTGGIPNSGRYSLDQTCSPLLPGASCALTYTYSPALNGRNDAESTLDSSAGAVVVTLTGAAVGSPLWVDTQQLNFGPQGVGSMSDVLSITLTNQGNEVIDSFAGGGPSNRHFTGSQDCAGGLAPGNSCSFNYRFTPESVGEIEGFTSISTSVGSISLDFRGTGVGPELWVTPRVIDFGPVEVGATLTREVAISNVGAADLSDFAGGGFVSSAPFSATQNCAGGVLPDSSCQYQFTFEPTEIGEVIATSNSSTNAGSFSIEVRGEGVPAGSLPTEGADMQASPLVLDFGPVPVGDVSPAQSVSIENMGDAILSNFAGGGVSGANFNGFQNCAGGLAPGNTCEFTYTFLPDEEGEFSGSTSISTDAGTVTIEMSGRGIGPELRASPSVLNFGTVSPNSTSDTLSVVITNVGATTLNDFAGGGVSDSNFSGSQNCAAGIEPGMSCQFNYTYSPSSPGFHEASTSISTNGGSVSISLSGGAVGP